MLRATPFGLLTRRCAKPGTSWMLLMKSRPRANISSRKLFVQYKVSEQPIGSTTRHRRISSCNAPTAISTTLQTPVSARTAATLWRQRPRCRQATHRRRRSSSLGQRRQSSNLCLRLTRLDRRHRPSRPAHRRFPRRRHRFSARRLRLFPSSHSKAPVSWARGDRQQPSPMHL